MPESQNSLVERFFRSWIGKLALILLFAPFAIVWIYGFLFGDAPPMNRSFGTWFIGSLTVAGIVTTVEFGKSVKQHGLSELGCVLPLAAVTCWWGYMFLQGIGVLK